MVIPYVLVSMVFLSLIQAQATLDQNGHVMLITYDIQQPTKAQAISSVDIWFHVKGRSYRVATHRYPVPVMSIRDTFPWFSRSKWQGGDLEIIFHGVDGSRVSRYIPESQIQRKFLGIPYDGGPLRVYMSGVWEGTGPDEYAWRHVGYDDESTFYYPFPLYPPLEFRWERRWGYGGTWASENSGAIANGVFCVAKEVAWNRIAAHNIQTGEVLWDRVATSNVWTASLAEGDTILFFGCSIGFTPWQDTTFYAMDLRTHEILWALVGYGTVEYSPLTVDSLVYVSTLQDTTSAYTVSGRLLWKAPLTQFHPVYAQDRVVGYSRTTMFPGDTFNLLICRDAYGGESLWAYAQEDLMGFPSLYEGRVYISFYMDKLFCFDLVTGDTVWWRTWTIPGLSVVPSSPFSHYNGLSFLSYGQWVGEGGTVTDTIYTHVEVYQSATGELLNHWIFTPQDSVGGTTEYSPITKGGYLWVNNNNCIYVYDLFQDSVISTVQLPPRYYVWYGGSWYFPIFWKKYLIHTTDHWIFVYQGLDTTASEDTHPPAPNVPRVWIPSVQRYPLMVSLTLRKSIPVDIDLYNATGQLRSHVLHAYLSPGESQLEFPSLLLPSGTYFLKVSLGTETILKKVVYFQTQGGVP